ncbi:battenin-like [Mizuhopecten yessoensis]|uniref:Battenin n=1 Tax=Mizuhopecten yessoensis TaxID=6573 RepID=A0A210PYK1_MIZYE|nr:battenin-like [Mizuhopecten yessoensis]OWF41561.1 Battenin [Mizuhopecten yessoensis]
MEKIATQEIEQAATTSSDIEENGQISETKDNETSTKNWETEENNTMPNEIPHKKRNLFGFWWLGLCNNFAYVIMLSAAHDILKEQGGGHSSDTNSNATTVAPVNSSFEYLQCNPISTGAILLADILPTLLIKLTAPFYVQRLSYRFKVSTVTLFCFLSFILVGFSQGIWMSITGVVCASIGGGLGEVTYLSYSAFFHRNVVSAYSSGTGGAGVFGALVYAGLTTAGLSPKATTLCMVIIPVIMAVNFFLVVKKPLGHSTPESDSSLLLMEETKKSKRIELSAKQKVALVVPLLKYMVPLMLVYFAEYFINQGLHEILYFNNIWLTKAEQYRWYQVDYQLGVFISRSSVNLLEIKKLWFLPVLQFINMGILLLQVFYQFIPSIWIVLAIVLYEGLLGGAAFVNTFFRISTKVEPEYREFSMGVASMADSVGIALAGTVTIPSHNRICALNILVPK